MADQITSIVEIEQPKSGGGKFFLIGCLSIIGIMVLCFIGSVYFIWSYMKSEVEKFASDTPIIATRFSPGQDEIDALLGKLSEFLSSGVAGSSVELTSSDLQRLLVASAFGTEAFDRSEINIKKDGIVLKLSIPLELIHIANRFVNVDTVLVPQLKDSAIALDILSAQLGDKKLDKKGLSEMQSPAWSETLKQEEWAKALISGASEIRLEEGKLIITKK